MFVYTNMSGLFVSLRFIKFPREWIWGRFYSHLSFWGRYALKRGFIVAFFPRRWCLSEKLQEAFFSVPVDSQFPSSQNNPNAKEAFIFWCPSISPLESRVNLHIGKEELEERKRGHLVLIYHKLVLSSVETINSKGTSIFFLFPTSNTDCHP